MAKSLENFYSDFSEWILNSFSLHGKITWGLWSSNIEQTVDGKTASPKKKWRNKSNNALDY